MIKTDLWNRIEPLLRKVERPSRYIGSEFGCIEKKDHDLDFCMVYPDTYELGQANQAVRILTNAVNDTDALYAERAYLPAVDMIDAMRDESIPMFSLESCAPLSEFDVIGITIPHELAATNILEVLDLSDIPIFAEDRTLDDPFVIAGGPCAFNPEPYAPFFDAILIGEGEECVPETLLAIRESKENDSSREDVLRQLSRIEGVYVPSLYRLLDEDEAQARGTWLVPIDENGIIRDEREGSTEMNGSGIPRIISKRVFEGFSESPGWENMIVPYTDVVHDRLNVEILRGCARGCRFCQAGSMYRPIRERSAENIIDSVKTGLRQTGYEEVSLTSLSSTDHSQIESILNGLNAELGDTGVRVSIPSQRLDSFGVKMAELVAGSKKGGLTFAPEAGTQRLRNVINKNISEEDLFNSLEAAIKAGWRHIKLYFMIGLPTETDEDIKGIASLAQRAYDLMRSCSPDSQRGALKLNVSVALFVPKSHTPFQWDGQISKEEAYRRVRLLKNSVKYKTVQINYHDPETSLIESLMSRGGRDVSELIFKAWSNGARFDAWSEHFDERAWRDAANDVRIDMEEYAQRTYQTNYIMPWEHISSGLSREYLVSERERAQKGISTPDCTFGDCTSCGVCMSLHVKNELREPRGDRLQDQGPMERA